MTGPTRGFTGARRRPADRRLPPGQYDVGADFPVLTAELTPNVDTERWSVGIDGLVGRPGSWTLADLQALPAAEYRGDIHCVTTWSKLGTSFGGVSLDSLLDQVGPTPDAAYALVHAVTGYTTNLPLDDLRGGRAWLVWTHEGRPLSPDHGGPVRLLVPHLYFWKSAKWVSRIELLDHEVRGFWETNGYHDRGDPWLEQRYTGD